MFTLIPNTDYDFIKTEYFNILHSLSKLCVSISQLDTHDMSSWVWGTLLTATTNAYLV